MLLVQLLLLAEQAHRFPVVGTLLPSSERQFGLPSAVRFPVARSFISPDTQVSSDILIFATLKLNTTSRSEWGLSQLSILNVAENEVLAASMLLNSE